MLPGRAHIIGIGKSGLAAALLLLRHGWSVIVSDISDGREYAETVSQLIRAGAKVFLGGHKEALEIHADMAVLSPGISLDTDVVKLLQNQRIPIISELELGWRYCNGRITAITGSNGKTTTTALLGEIFSHSGYPSYSVGNIGLPLSDVADRTTKDALLAVEVSSFQLMTIDKFKPKIAILLNLSADHLDWHGGFEKYAEAKARLWMNQTKDDWLIYNMDDPNVVYHAEKSLFHRFPYSFTKEFEVGAFMQSSEFVVRLPDGSEFRQDRSELKLLGRHNATNALSAISAALLLDVHPNAVRNGVSSFKGYPHRLEKVRERRGVIWLNDSKATNVDAGLVALEAVEKPIVLIAGGRGKGGGFRDFLNGPVDRIKTALLIGETACEIEKDIGNKVKTIHADNLEDAVEKANRITEPGDTVLFSPLCASFDMFHNYEERGECFRQLVKELPDV
ncbi:MAG: UDP-N-acetylmuramoyl-L-alanine--D-glutamate ligase [Candidatus Hatepunaea meridiana]|nr:UDP-N-acetylmuramoyl-L-alanine--D-glutamate ligase [Candidatus Hatepunaea meridiana]